jgi:hypothetical protein
LKARLESEKRVQRRAVEWTADLHLDHIARYLEQEYDFDGGFREMRREADRLRPLIREALIDELLANPDMSAEEIRESIEDRIEDLLYPVPPLASLTTLLRQPIGSNRSSTPLLI